METYWFLMSDHQKKDLWFKDFDAMLGDAEFVDKNCWFVYPKPISQLAQSYIGGWPSSSRASIPVYGLVDAKTCFYLQSDVTSASLESGLVTI